MRRANVFGWVVAGARAGDVIGVTAVSHRDSDAAKHDPNEPVLGSASDAPSRDRDGAERGAPAGGGDDERGERGDG